MKTAKQEALVASYLSQFDNDTATLYAGIIDHLSRLGYNPAKQKTQIIFKHDLHNKQIAKMDVKIKKNTGASPYLALRLSACRGYSQKIADIIGAYVKKYPARAAQCVNGKCDFCAGEATTHVYTHTTPDGEVKYHCGAYAIEITFAAEDIDELKRLIEEEHEYLMRHEAK